MNENNFTNLKINLVAARELINLNTNIHVEIEYLYEDYGAGLMHYNLVTQGKESYQVLLPRDAHLAYIGELSLEAVYKTINNINERGW